MKKVIEKINFELEKVKLKLQELDTFKSHSSYDKAKYLYTGAIEAFDKSLNIINSSDSGRVGKQVMVNADSLELLKEWAYNNVKPYDEECHDIIDNLNETPVDEMVSIDLVKTFQKLIMDGSVINTQVAKKVIDGLGK